MRAPIFASVSAATSPIPEVAPVITTVLPFISARILVSCYAVAALSSIGSTIEGSSFSPGQSEARERRTSMQRAISH